MKYFGTDGIRGIPGETLSYSFIEKLGNSLLILNQKKIYISMDTRLSSPLVFDALAKGITTAGMDVYNLGISTTPSLIFYSMMNNVLSIMITASHNPYYDNGIKIILNGKKLNNDLENKIEYFIDENPYYISSNKGNIYKLDNAFDSYLNHLNNYKIKNDLKIVIDTANGAASLIAKEAFKNISDNIIFIADKPNGKNVNENCGCTHISFLKENVLKNNADIGFAYDGDADRIICVTKKGRILTGDEIIYFIASYLNKRNLLKQNKIVLTIMSNPLIEKKLEEKGISYIETQVGDKYVLEELIKNNLSLGGEASGHIILNDIFQSGDGILISLIILEILKLDNINIDDFFKDVNLYYDKMVNIKVPSKTKIMTSKELFLKQNEIKNKLGPYSKVIIRPSGTEDIIRLSIIAEDKEKVEEYINILKDMILNIK